MKKFVLKSLKNNFNRYIVQWVGILTDNIYIYSWLPILHGGTYW